MLLAAAGLLIPLAIHLWNKRPPRLLATGSIRWFRGSTSQSARSLQLKELPLLLLRCLMLFVFCLLMAGVYWQGAPAEKENKRGLYLVEAGLVAGKSQSWVDSLSRQRKEVRLLAPGLPMLADSLHWKGRRINSWGIIKEAEEQQGFSDSVWIHVPLMQRYFSGERPKVHKQIIFIEPEDTPQTLSFPVQRIREGEKVLETRMTYSPERIAFETRELTGSDAETNKVFSEEERPAFFEEEKITENLPDTFQIAIVKSENYKADEEIVRMAFQVLDDQLPAISFFFRKEGTLSEADLVIWLSENPFPSALLEAGVPVLGINDTTLAGQGWIIRDQDYPSLHFLRKRPLPEVVEAVELARLPLALLELLPEGVESRYTGYLRMPLDQAQPVYVAGGSERSVDEKQSLHEWLWVLLFALFTVERLWVNLK